MVLHSLAKILLLMALAVLSCGAGKNHRLALRVGEHHMLDVGHAVELSVSRRGVVDVHAVSQGTFELTAMRRGLVVVEARDAETGDVVPPRYVVAVTDADHGRTATVGSAAGEEPFWACAEPGMQCSQTGHVVKGTADDVLWLLSVQNDCVEGGRVCDITLSEPSREAWRQQLATKLGAAYDVVVSPAANVTVETACAPLSPRLRRAEIEGRLTAMLHTAQIEVVCSEHMTGRVFRIAARIVATSKGQASGAGFDGRSDLQVQLHRQQAPGVLWRSSSAMAANAAEQTGEIVGAPEVLVATGESVEVTTGGEFQVDPHQTGTTNADAGIAHWRRHGLALKLGLEQAVAAGLRLHYELAIRSRPGSGNASQESHTLAGTLPMIVDTPVMAGSVDVHSETSARRWTRLFADIPIIGPLWRLTLTDEGATTLQLWLTVKSLD